MYTGKEWEYSNLSTTGSNAKNRSKDVFMSINWADENSIALSRVQEIISFNSKFKDPLERISLGMWGIEFPVHGENGIAADQAHRDFASKWWVSDLYKNISTRTKETFGEFLTPKTAITELPLETNFNLGKGLHYYKNGIIDNPQHKNWGNLSEQDYLVTSIVHNEKLIADYDFLNVFNGGSSYAINSKGFYGEIPIYYTWIEKRFYYF